MTGLLLPCIYAGGQIVCLFFLRKIALLTVYQTVAAYGVLSLLGIAFCVFAQRCQGRGEDLRDSYLVLWSGLHGAVVLGFLTRGSFCLTLTEITLVQAADLFLTVAIYWVFYLISGCVSFSIGMGNLLIGIVGTVNHYLVRFRGAPFQISDIKAARTARNVVANYHFMPDVVLVLAIGDLVIWYVLWKRYLEKRRRYHLGLLAGAMLMIGGCVVLPIREWGGLYSWSTQFALDTFWVSLAAQVQDIANPLPEDYSVERVERIIHDFEEEGAVAEDIDSGTEMPPNIVVIMNETFSDLRVLGELDTTVPVLPYWDSLKSNSIYGWANVSVLGGTTANTEYEFLSSDAVGLYPSAVPYNKYFTAWDAYPCLVSVLKQYGYETTAFHPYLSSGWNRTQVYRAMQFDHMIFQEDLDEELDTIRSFVSDAADFEYIEKYFTQKKRGVPQFYFNVTMQNHGGYTYEGDDFETEVRLAGKAEGQFPQAEQFLTLMKESDEALKGLLEFFTSYDEPVIVVMFGDHQPKLEDEFYEYITGEKEEEWSFEQRMRQYKTPFMIWANESAALDTPENTGDVSVNYLALLLMQRAGLPMSEYQQFVWREYSRYPVVSQLGLQDASGNQYVKGTEAFQTLTQDYRMLIYNHTVDTEHRYEDFFR